MARSSRAQERDREVQPPRPPNAWIIYRSERFNEMRSNNERLSQADVSKRISEMWRNETEEVKRHYEQQAEAKKMEHQKRYPDYRFNPLRKEPKIPKPPKAPRKGSRKPKACGDPTPAVVEATDKEEGQDDNASPPTLAFPVTSCMQPQPRSGSPPVPEHYHHLVMPQHFMVPYLPGAYYGHVGPSSPVSAAPSPAPHVGSESPVPPLSAASSSSSLSTQQSPSSESQASSSSSQLPTNPTYLPSPSTSHQPSPDPYATLPLLFQNFTPSEQPLASPRLQLRSSENTVTPAGHSWSDISAYLPTTASQNSDEVVNLNFTITQQPTYAELQQSMSPSSSFDSFHALLSGTDENGVFNLSNIESSAFLTQPLGDLEIVMGPQATLVDDSEDTFADFDFDGFQTQIDPWMEGSSSSATMTSCSIPEDLRSLFHTPSNPDLQAYTITQQRQPSAFTQEMLNFLNFEAVEDPTEDAVPGVSPCPLPTCTVAPQQVRLQSPQVAPAMPIFTQMTNTSLVTPGNSYVPPAGAIYSSTRRVGGTWKPSFIIPDDTVSSWTL